MTVQALGRTKLKLCSIDVVNISQSSNREIGEKMIEDQRDNLYIFQHFVMTREKKLVFKTEVTFHLAAENSL
jgi:hypothetical protein